MEMHAASSEEAETLNLDRVLMPDPEPLVSKHCEFCHATVDVPMDQRLCSCGGLVYLHNRSVGCRCPKP